MKKIILDFYVNEDRKLQAVGLTHEGVGHCTADVRFPSYDSVKHGCIVISDFTKNGSNINLSEIMEKSVLIGSYDKVTIESVCNISFDSGRGYTYISPSEPDLVGLMTKVIFN